MADNPIGDFVEKWRLTALLELKASGIIESCKDEEKYTVIDEMIKKFKNYKSNKTLVDDQVIKEILTVNGVRFTFDDGSWGLIRASSNKPSLVVVTESPTSDERKKAIFNFIDQNLKSTGKIGEYDQKI